MAHKKRRVFQHIMEDNSIDLLKQKLPAEWVLRKYNPDYGIDLSIELFQSIDGGNEKFETLGEFLFAQVKSINKTEIDKIDVYSRMNVEKQELTKSPKGDKSTIEVIKFQIDTNELLTVQAVGNGIPVLLIVICLDKQKAYFVCLNDYIDKIIVHENPEFYNQKSITIYIPINNEILNDHDFLVPLRFYAKRPKLYAAFSKFVYQQHEMQNLLVVNPESEEDNFYFPPESLRTILHFISIIKRFDFWHDMSMWKIIAVEYLEICNAETIINKRLKGVKLAEKDFQGFTTWDLSEVKKLEIEKGGQIDDSFMDEMIELMIENTMNVTWGHLANLNNIFEEICREWCLPTYLSRLSSYREITE